MSQEPIQPTAGSVSPLIAAAKDWAGRRKPADLCLELFVRMAELMTITDHLAQLHGLNLDGQAVAEHPQHPQVPYAYWAVKLVPDPLPNKEAADA